MVAGAVTTDITRKSAVTATGTATAAPAADRTAADRTVAVAVAVDATSVVTRGGATVPSATDHHRSRDRERGPRLGGFYNPGGD